MTDDISLPPISLAAERSKRERDFATERADLLRELRDIGVEETEFAAFVQRLMVLEWSVFHAARMLNYHDIEQSPEAMVELVKLMARARDGSA